MPSNQLRVSGFSPELICFEVRGGQVLLMSNQGWLCVARYALKTATDGCSMPRESSSIVFERVLLPRVLGSSQCPSTVMNVSRFINASFDSQNLIEIDLEEIIFVCGRLPWLARATSSACSGL